MKLQVVKDYERLSEEVEYLRYQTKLNEQMLNTLQKKYKREVERNKSILRLIELIAEIEKVKDGKGEKKRI